MAYCECLLSSIASNGEAGTSPLSHVPVRFGDSDTGLGFILCGSPFDIFT